MTQPPETPRQRHPARAELVGAGFDYDRLWLVHTPEGAFGFTDYNWEITGFHPKLAELSDSICYAGSAYYVVTHLAPQKGWHVEAIDDR